MGGCYPAVGLSSAAASGSEIPFYRYHGALEFGSLRSRLRPAGFAEASAICPIN